MKYDNISGVPIRSIIDQINSRRKAKTKLPGWINTNGIVFPPPLSLEQCSSEETAKFKSGIMSGEELVDLTGGTGVDTVEFSKVFNHVHFVDIDNLLCSLAQNNFPLLGAQNIRVQEDSADHFVKNVPIGASIYIDPSRRQDSKKVFRLEDCEPNMKDLLPVLLTSSKEILIKTSPLLEPKSTINELEHVKSVYIVSLKNEVKELLLHIVPTFVGHTEFICVDLNKNVKHSFSFTHSEEKETEAKFSIPKKYIYEPMSVILKGGAFRSVATRFGLYKLAPNSHLYTSDELVSDFPGKCFHLIETLSAKEASRKIKKSNIATRNYPISAELLKKKLKIEDGGHDFLYGTTLLNKKKVLLRLQKV